MEELTEKKINSTLVFDGDLLKVHKDSVLLPNGKTATREWIKHPGAAAVVPVLADGRIVMVKQYRYPVGKVTLEIPAGKLDLNEAPEICARRELKEETGFEASVLEKLSAIGTTMAFSDEMIHLYIATDLTKGESCPDEDEFINTVALTPEEIQELILDGGIYDAKTVAALLLAKEKLAALNK